MEPHSHSVDFAGVHVNLKQLAISAGLHHTYVSRVFGGTRPLPRIQTARIMADVLGMPFDDFIMALERRAAREILKRRRRLEALDEARSHATLGRHPRTASL